MNPGFLKNVTWTGAVALCLGCATSAPLTDLGAKAKKLGGQLTAAVTPKPKVGAAQDPVSLSSEPKPVPAELYTQAAWHAEQQGHVNSAQEQYERALKADRRDLTTLISYARFLDRNGKPDDALRMYQTAQSVAPQQPIVWNDMGLFYARKREWQPALQALRQAVALQPNNLRYRNNVAAVLIEAQRIDDAVRELEAVHPPALARYNVGCLLELHHMPEAASQYFAQATQLDPALAAQLGQPEAGPQSSPPGRVSAIPVSTRGSGAWAETAGPDARLQPPGGDGRTLQPQPRPQPSASLRNPRDAEPVRLPTPDFAAPR